MLFILRAFSRARSTLNHRLISNAPLRPKTLWNLPPVSIYTPTRWVASTVSDPPRVSFAAPSNHREFLVSCAEEAWPPPPSIPSGWSCVWKNWPYLMTLYWPSPYYLMLLQIEMIVNIRHRIFGETRPLLYSNRLGAVIFTLVASPTEFFFLDIVKTTLYRIGGVKNEPEMTQLVRQGDEALEGQLHVVPPDEEGEKALGMILERDPNVIPVLAKKFLPYEPTPTEPWEELENLQVKERDNQGEQEQAENGKGG